MFHSTHFNVKLTLAQEQGVWRALHTCVILMRSCCVLLDSLRRSLFFFAFHLLSHLPLHSPVLHLFLPNEGQEPFALFRMRTLAPLPRTTLSHLMAQLSCLEQCPKITLKDLSRLHPFGPKVLPGLFLGFVLYARGIWKGDIMIADID